MSIGRTGARAAFAAVGVLVAMALGAGSALAVEAKFGYTGAEQEFTVPAGVTSVHVVAIGGAGGAAFRFSSSLERALGGRGAVVSGDLSVTPGPLYVEVGGSAAGREPCEEEPCAGEFNGGGESQFGGLGGGASDVRTTSRSQPGTLESRLLVAAGGGGGGLGCETGVGLPGGAGGDAEKPGGEGSNCGEETGKGGGAGKETEGGVGGSPAGEPGSLGTGGKGGSGSHIAGITGGGGGGGLYGGGGGGAASLISTFAGGAGGGGGGSNLVAGGKAALDKNEAAPSVTITYTVVVPKCTKAFGRASYLRVGETGRLNLLDKLNKNPAEPQTLRVSYESGAVRYRLTKLLSAKCEGFPGKREFVGVGEAAKGTDKGYGLEFKIRETPPSGYRYEATLSKEGTTLLQEGGPLMKIGPKQATPQTIE